MYVIKGTKPFPIHVRTGGRSKRVSARERLEAVRLVLDKTPPKFLGSIVSMHSKHFAWEEGAMTFYLRTAGLLREVKIEADGR